MPFDVRTRVDGTSEPLDPARLFDEVLPSRFAEMQPRLAPAVHRYATAPLTVDVDGGTWHLRMSGARVEVGRGAAEGRARVRLDGGQVADLADDQATPFSWLSTGRLELEGSFEDLLDWWLFVRGALDDRVPYVGPDPEGADPPEPFRLDDPVQDQRDFLERNGYLHLAGVFSEAEMAQVSADMDAAAPTYSQGDGRSWWARTADGTDRLVRMQGFDGKSAAVARIVADERLAHVRAIPDSGHEFGWGRMDDNRIEALIKPLAVVRGISDVPWHKDCSLGRHSYECCGLTVGISVTGADRQSGQLRVVAGSHRHLVWPALLRSDLDLPVVDLPTETGDVTVHLSCTLHMAQPPVDRERRVLYTGFRLPDLPGTDRSRRAQIRRVREAAHTTVSQPPAPSR